VLIALDVSARAEIESGYIFKEISSLLITERTLRTEGREFGSLQPHQLGLDPLSVRVTRAQRVDAGSASTSDPFNWTLRNATPLSTVATSIQKAPLRDWFELGGEVAQGLRFPDHSISRQGGGILGDRSDDLNHIVNMALV